MDSKVWLIVLALAVVVVAESSNFDEPHWALSQSAVGNLPTVQSCNGRIGDCLGDEEELMPGSESDRRQLRGRRRYISYDALRRNNVPCSRRGWSYYNCRGNVQANPYSRGCSQITRCARYLG